MATVAVGRGESDGERPHSAACLRMTDRNAGLLV